MSVTPVSFDDYTPSTVTMVAGFDKTINVTDIAKYLPVVHLFNKKTSKRIKLVSGNRCRIEYYGFEKIIISVCYKKIRRGMRTGAMNNMISIDLQFEKKNIHIKLSSNTMTSVGTPGYEEGVKVFKIMLSHINMLNSNIKYNRNIDKNVMKKNLSWLFNNCINKKNELYSTSHMLKRLEKTYDIDKRVIKSLIVYIDDFESDEIEEFKEKILLFINECSYFEGKLNYVDPSIFNSVYHLNIFGKISDHKRIPNHKLAPYLADKGFIIEFHNWTSEGVNICFDIEEEKKGSHHNNKEYKHRFTINNKGTMRQCSPTFKDEAYKYYMGTMKQIEIFLKNIDNIDYKSYVKEEQINEV
jgi:hypothetical protein